MQDTTNIHEVLTDEPEHDDMPWPTDFAVRGPGTRPTQHERINEYAGAKVRPMADPGPLRILAYILKGSAYEGVVSLTRGEAEYLLALRENMSDVRLSRKR